MANNTPSSSQSPLIFTIGLQFGGNYTKNANKSLNEFIISQGLDEDTIHARHRQTKALIVKNLLQSIFTSGGFIMDKDKTYNIHDIYVDTTYYELTEFGKTVLDKLKKYLQNKTQHKLNLAEAAEGKIIKKQRNEVPLPAVTHKDDSLLQLDESLPDSSQVPVMNSPSVNPDSTQLDESLPGPSQVPIRLTVCYSVPHATSSLRDCLGNCCLE